MKTKVDTINTNSNSYLIFISQIVTDIGYGLLELTGYSKDEIVNKDITEVLTKLLRFHQESSE
ncbi:MAG TPA: hypothetical protein VIK78_04915 [Ruminiclostridium sp.]